MKKKRLMYSIQTLVVVMCFLGLGQEIVQAHPNNKIFLDQGEVTEFIVDEDAEKTKEPAAIDAGYSEYRQTPPPNGASLVKDGVYTNSTPLSDIYLGNSYFIGNNKIITGINHSNRLNRSSDIPENTFSEIHQYDFSSDPVIDKYVYSPKNTPSLVYGTDSRKNDTYSTASGLYENGDGTFSMIWQSALNGPTITKVDSNMTVLNRSPLQNVKYEGHVYNRSSLGIDNKIYAMAYMDSKATSTSKFKVYDINSSTGNTNNAFEIQTLDNKFGYESIMGERPENWYEGLLTQTFTAGGNNLEYYVGVSMMYNHSSIGLRQHILTIWNKQGNVVGYYKPDKGSQIAYVRELSDATNYYFTETSSTGTMLKKLDVSTQQVTTLKEYPKGSNILFKKKDNTITFAGFTPTFTGDLMGYGDRRSAFIGVMDDNFDIKSISVIPEDNSIKFTDIIQISENEFFFTGTVIGQGFVENGNWAIKEEPGYFSAIYGRLKLEEDFPPLINEEDQTVKIDIDDPDIKQASVLDNWLITGKKAGTFKDKSAIKVYDMFDLNKSLAGYDQDWLDKRINKNPNNMTKAIEWNNLGFDKTKPGPQRVTYFVTDSQKQSSSLSRWVNAVDDQTVFDKTDSVYLRAENFAINKQQVASLTEDSLKEYAKTMAWVVKPGDLDKPLTEDGQNKQLSSKVTINQEQLKTIQSATSSEKAKPYPLDITYTDLVDSREKNVVKRIWVFVTNDNTAVDNGVVLYADNFSLPLLEAQQATADKLLTKAKYKQTQPSVVVYDFKEQPQKKNDLTALSIGKTDGESKGLSATDSSLSRLKQGASNTQIKGFEFTYKNPKDKKVTTVLVDVTIDDEKEFCYILERNQDKLTIEEPILDASIDGSYKSVEVKVPSHVTLDSKSEIPKKWQQLTDLTDATSRTYRFNMNQQNDLASITQFVDKSIFNIDDPVDKPGSISITLREDELLKDTPVARNMVHQEFDVITPGDFSLVGESKWDDTLNKAYVDLEWEKQNGPYDIYKGQDKLLDNVSNQFAQTYQVTDDASPEITKLVKTKDNKVYVTGEDLGTKHTFSVVNKEKKTSDIISIDVISDIKGYVYEIDSTMGTEPTIEKDSTGNVTNINSPVLNPNLSRVGEISGFDSLDQWLHVVAIDRSNNVSTTKHIQLKDIAYEAYKKPENISCDADIPQKIYVTGKDTKGNNLQFGDDILDKNLRIGNTFTLVPKSAFGYNHVMFKTSNGQELTPPTGVIQKISQSYDSIYERTVAQVNVRQVILKGDDNLVLPRRGEGVINSKNQGIVKGNIPIEYPTLFNWEATFKPVKVLFDKNQADYTLVPIIPEYYKYEGYVLSTELKQHDPANLTLDVPNWNMTTEPDVWITIYLSGQQPGFYGWQYGDDGKYVIVP